MRLYAFAALLASAVTAAPALAADLPPPVAPPPRAPAAYVPVAPPFTWTGIYVGVNGGYSWANWSDGFGDTFTPSDGWLVGATLGFNYQINQFVIGVEGDIDWSGMKWTQSAVFSDPFFGTAGASITNKDETLGTFAARFGYAMDRALLFVKAGGAWTHEVWDLSATNVLGATVTSSNSFDRFGWMVGAGLEYAITDNITVKGEYNFVDFGTSNENLSITAPTGGTLTGTVPSKLYMNVFRVGVNYLFH